MNVLAVCSLLLLLRQVTAIRQFTRATSADQSRRWAVVATAVCLAAAICRFPWLGVSLQMQSAVQYFAAVMLLAPFIAILGARRPGAVAWPWFVVLPLVVVLQWPSLSQLLAENAETAIEVPTPTVIGFLFVLIMGAGNYFGTINTAATAICTIAIVLIVLPVTEWCSFKNTWSFPTGCLLLAFAALLLPGRYSSIGSNSKDDAGGAGQLWIDFRDVYGIVWAKRVMDRVNQFAEREHWVTRLTLDGFVATGDGEPISEFATNREIQVLCWVLKRFVDRPFLCRYLAESQLTTDTAATDDERSI